MRPIRALKLVFSLAALGTGFSRVAITVISALGLRAESRLTTTATAAG